MNKSKLYKVSVYGCDDSTVIYRIINNSKELELIKDLAQQITETSHYGCMPTMEVEEFTNSDEQKFDVILTTFGYEPEIYEIYDFIIGKDYELLLEYDKYEDAIQSGLKHKDVLRLVLNAELTPVEDPFSPDYILRKF